MKALSIMVTLALYAPFGAAHAQSNCEYLGQQYGVGATICECPGLKASNVGSTDAHGQIISRRLSCSKEQTWTDTDSLCVDASGQHIQEEYPKYVAMFCPRTGATMQKAEHLDTGTGRAHAFAPDGLCRRLVASSLTMPCKALWGAIQATFN